MCSITFRAPEDDKETLEAIASRYQIPSSHILRVLLNAHNRGLISYRDYEDLETPTEEPANV